MWDIDDIKTKYTQFQVNKLLSHIPLYQQCPICDSRFDAQSYIFRPTAIYPRINVTCSDQCKRVYGGRKNKQIFKSYLCGGCNQPFIPHPRKPHQQYCNKKCRGIVIRGGQRPEMSRWIHKIKPPRGSISKSCTEWLTQFNITHIEHDIVINDRLFRVDGYDQKTNTIYEYLGSFWHGNPLLYPQDKIHPVCKKTFGFLYQKTINRIKTLESAGFVVIYEWSKK